MKSQKGCYSGSTKRERKMVHFATFTRFCSASDCHGSVWTREYSKQRTTELFQIEDNSDTTHWSDGKDAQLQSSERKDWNRVVTKSQKGTKVIVERKVGESFQWKANGQCLRGDSCSTEVIVDKRYKRALLLQLRSHRLTKENPRMVVVPEEKALLEEKAECRAKKSSNESVRTRRVIVGTLPYV